MDRLTEDEASSCHRGVGYRVGSNKELKIKSKRYVA